MRFSEKAINHITNWLVNYLEKSKMKGFVVGVSGGVDSALTATLCARTEKPVLCLEMNIHQQQDQVSRAHQHIAWLEAQHSNVSHHHLNLTPAFEAFQQTFLKSGEPSERESLSLANARSRLRMTTLYYYAGIHSYLVAGTGNKIEDFGVGFFTKYGDGGVDVAPIADLYKSEVYALAAHLGVHSDILEAPPTDGLWDDDRTDEQQLGVSYDALEWAMKAVAAQQDPEGFSKAEKKAYDTYLRFHRQNQHKMESIPVCVLPEGLW